MHDFRFYGGIGVVRPGNAAVMYPRSRGQQADSCRGRLPQYADLAERLWVPIGKHNVLCHGARADWHIEQGLLGYSRGGALVRGNLHPM
jgi:hypothetical protein